MAGLDAMGFLEFITDIKNAGGRAYLVGGCVRDRLLGLAGKDKDLEVFGIEPEQLIHICRQHGRVVTAGLAFAVLKVTLKSKEELDVSLPRREKAIGGGHKDFLVSADPYMTIEEAALRRDLTINAISMDPLTGELFDPVNGILDLKNKILRHVGPRFSEDPLRVLRVIQFQARFGFEIHPATSQLCRQIASTDHFKYLPRERIEEEIKKLIVKGIPRHVKKSLISASEMGVLASIFPELEQLEAIPQDPRYHAEGNCLIHTIMTVDNSIEISIRDSLSDEERLILGLAALAHDLGKIVTTEIHPDGSITSYRHDRKGMPAVERLIGRITNNQAIIAPVLALVRMHMRPLHLAVADRVSDAAIRRLAKEIQPSNLDDLARLVEADTKASLRTDGSTSAEAHLFLRERSRELGVSNRPLPPLIQGRDLKKLAEAGRIGNIFLSGGPHFKSVLDAVYEAQLEGSITEHEQALLFVIDWIDLHPETGSLQE